MSDEGELRALFCDALDRTPTERADYLDRACQGRPALRARMEALLRAEAEAGEFLQEPDGFQEISQRPTYATECVGSQIGPYKLLESIGEGGMGIVWMAEQQEPVRRQVAL